MTTAEPGPRRRSTDREGDDWRQPVRAEPGDDVVTRSLITAIGGLAGDVRMLVATVASDRRLRWAVLIALGFAIVVLLMVGIFGGAFVLRAGKIQAEQRRQGVEIHEQARRLIECTTPGDPGSSDPTDRVHECFDESLRNQAEAIAKITDTNGNGIPDTQELLANQATAAKARGITLPYGLAPSTPPTTVKH